LRREVSSLVVSRTEGWAGVFCDETARLVFVDHGVGSGADGAALAAVSPVGSSCVAVRGPKHLQPRCSADRIWSRLNLSRRRLGTSPSQSETSTESVGDQHRAHLSACAASLPALELGPFGQLPPPLERSLLQLPGPRRSGAQADCWSFAGAEVFYITLDCQI
jgi:hypothetical protein